MRAVELGALVGIKRRKPVFEGNGCDDVLAGSGVGFVECDAPLDLPVETNVEL